MRAREFILRTRILSHGQRAGARLSASLPPPTRDLYARYVVPQNSRALAADGGSIGGDTSQGISVSGRLNPRGRPSPSPRRDGYASTLNSQHLGPCRAPALRPPIRLPHFPLLRPHHASPCAARRESRAMLQYPGWCMAAPVICRLSVLVDHELNSVKSSKLDCVASPCEWPGAERSGWRSSAEPGSSDPRLQAGCM